MIWVFNLFCIWRRILCSSHHKMTRIYVLILVCFSCPSWREYSYCKSKNGTYGGKYVFEWLQDHFLVFPSSSFSWTAYDFHTLDLRIHHFMEFVLLRNVVIVLLVRDKSLSFSEDCLTSMVGQKPNIIVSSLPISADDPCIVRCPAGTACEANLPILT